MGRLVRYLIGFLAVLNGVVLSVEGQSSRRPTIADQAQAFGELSDLVRRHYYEEVDQVDLYDGAIEGYLSHLDPHSTYISAEDFREMQERLEGAFEGIGIYFEIIEDFLTVLSPIEGSPASEVGLLPGDRIFKIDGTTSVGIKISEVEGRLKGPKGTTVHVSVQREGVNVLLEFDIKRDKIRVPSVRYAFMIAEDVGYVKVDRFSGRTGDELETALAALSKRGMAKLVLDLRNNGGGYLEQAVAVSDQLLDPGRLVVYTEGRRRGSREDHFSQTVPLVPEAIPLIVLVNSRSASASEIVAGAVQDYDRGLIVGHTTFGKGLVQKQYGLQNGGAVLLTVASYFTPSGRPIQRPYSGDRLAYLEAAHDDYDPNADGTIEKPIYYTEILAREVYGSGGITPDVVLSPDTLTAFERHLVSDSLVLKFATHHGQELTRSHVDFDSYFEGFDPGRRVLSKFRKFLEAYIPRFGDDEARSLKQSTDFVRRRLRRQIAQIRWGTAAAGRIGVEDDPVVQESLVLFDKALALLDSRAFHGSRRRLNSETDRVFENVR
jgi:carboxyl-terminal processing protease